MHPQGARRRRSRRARTPASPRASISYVQHADSAAWCMLPLWEIFACEVAAHFHMRASDHSSSRFMPSCHSARSSPRRPFRWKSVAPGRYASLERACFSRRSGRPRWRVRKAAACTIHVVGRARRALPSPHAAQGPGGHTRGATCKFLTSRQNMLATLPGYGGSSWGFGDCVCCGCEAPWRGRVSCARGLLSL